MRLEGKASRGIEGERVRENSYGQNEGRELQIGNDCLCVVMTVGPVDGEENK